ncbi:MULTISPECIES: DNA polymerase III subunit delta' [unclassified Curtobacterium]|uniref:DNA polymerase III subunit delta' n=1 Tax=unclassified Curtobacterium TaxID=257496 RepID=UPI0008259B47|nr:MULTISPECIES: DNA polymerase III subunit delta' [unclassified Curtobacterium]WIA95713.1 DNA polymerase III subunit delta' [Curtobacterium sp. MCBA15_004]WIA99077.1 DNA polymerase III subunit delta' [Curtobacterium sp. MCBA15_012]
MSVWDGLTGQDDAVAALRSAAEGPEDTGGMTHSWLITGPPGSGRSNVAAAFAAALVGSGPDDDHTLRLITAGTHPDVSVLTTQRVIITIEEIRKLVTSSYYSPSVGRYRVVIVEDADRMTERTSNLLLKALEEPPERTVWILCAPSEADLLPTIRSRVRSVRLRVPGIDSVADLIVARTGVDRELATDAARQAQSHIGMAQRLATSADARDRRRRTLTTVLRVRSVGDAVLAAAELLAVADEDAKAITQQRDAEERDAALRSLGVEPGGTVPPALRSQLRAMEEDQKRRATRSLRDGLDRILVDVSSLYRDLLLLGLGVPTEPVNESMRAELDRALDAVPPASALEVLDAVSLARNRIAANVAALLALEALLVTVARATR